ncbi:heterokaryon incompatibility protein-domain-containing protein [Dactylonectria estremocensis]|uniref:Heterokaryon incompatibility protein-domain-containing protein n=1 Tax=Dactylonectria estremocensis TaxID=1079267 RepID=A0A9P9F750_9HYPO|nr:heterokaryon incompatibility protein-domain-containing protein [Dactylonectria estremocensis]
MSSCDIRSSGIAFITGRVGHHRIVAVSNNATPRNNPGDIADAVLQEFPAIRAGLLVSTDGITPQNGNGRVGDVVIGMGSRVHPGVAQFDLPETIKQKRLFVTNLSRSPPRAIVSALYALSDPIHHGEWLRRLEQKEPQPKIFRGLIVSSEQRPNGPALIDSIGAQNHVLCFGTAAVNLRHRPFTVISGIASSSGETQPQLPSSDVGKVATSYATCLTRHIDLVKLAAEIPIAEHFEDEAFNLDRSGFRLLRLQAGTGPVRCHVFQAYLNDESLIPYEALSYCWGSNVLTDSICVNDKILPTTSNLADALLHLRHVDEDWVLWIDAICIDQANVRERGHQVGYVGLIYSRAELVLIWLGYIDPTVGPLISSLKEFEKCIPPCAWRDWSYGDPRWSGAWEEAQNLVLDVYESDDVDYQPRLSLLMNTPWFGRVWILQECQAIIDIMPEPSRKSSWWTGKQNFCTLLWRFRGSQASEPRDRLYALLDLASDINIKKKIKVDYSNNENAIIDDITSYLFGKYQDSNRFKVRDIADLQQKIPNLSCMALERMISSERQINEAEVQEFLLRQNKTVWLSETAASYLWYVRPELMDYFINEAAIKHVAMGRVEETSTLDRTVILKPFEDWRNGRGFVFEITEAVITKAITSESGILKLLFEKRGKDVHITGKIIKASHQNGIDIVRLVAQCSQGNIRISQALFEESLKQGPDSLELLLDTKGNEILPWRIPAYYGRKFNTLKIRLDGYGKQIRTDSPPFGL